MNRQSSNAPVRILPITAILLAFAATLPTGAPAAQDQTTIEGMRDDIEVLKQGQAVMQKDLAEIKRMLQRAPPRAQPQPFQPLDIDIAGAASRGAQDAPVTMIEFTDYQCPYCGHYVRQTLPEILKNYVDTGKVRYLIREMPLTNIHPYAQKAAEAARCAGIQGKYWAMHDILFKNQAHLKPDELATHAKAAGLDLPQFSHCLDGNLQAQEVQHGIRSGRQAGVGGTPTLFLGRTNPQTPDKLHATQMIRGTRPWMNFKQTIDTLLESPQQPKGSVTGG
jgi:protein-disulfide isomerase